MQKIIGFIDRLISRVGDEINPIMVLELRRQFNLVKYGTYFAIMYGLFGFIAAIMLIMPEDKLRSYVNLIIATDWVSFAILIIVVQFMLIIIFALVGMIHLTLFYWWRDPLILSAVNDVCLYRGLYQIGLFYVIKSFCLLYFWIVVLYFLEIIPLELFLIFPVLWLLSVVIGNIFFAFLIIFRKNKFILFGVMYLMMLIISMTVLFTLEYITIWHPILGITINLLDMLLTKQQFMTTWNWIFVPFGMSPIFVFATWKLINFNLTSNTTICKKLIKLIATYSILIIVTIIALYLSMLL
jgi:hypothetical protein